MKYLALILPIFLVGCACKPQVITETMEVPVAVSCVKQTPAKPGFPLQEAKFDEDMFTLAKKALAEIEIRKGYEGELEAVITGCTSTK
jgi:hypothetical protein